ncbi:tRNA epoxyqueuosine(34) reductase QueG [Fontimonas sp. SYSU GA230001]|uniref:tRNA epoxyqueuosine(34) reductase QueG n=1 Tax=Fontimonas sp. SYSU GA230001 TaxID=3142450 RepID=UPI0032B589B0
MHPDTPTAIARQIPVWARELGFADAEVSARRLDADRVHLADWIALGRHGGMSFMARDPDLRAEPERLRPGTLSVISARLPYRPDAADALALLDDGAHAYISRYALGRDYHRVVRARLLRLGRRIEQAVGPHGYRVLCDSAPVLEKALARDAGLGWIGKHTLLLNKQEGSWFFLGEIYTDLPLPPTPGAPPDNGCGRCTACIKVCPTQAIVAPYQLDARRCISYLTIEHHGSIDEDLRPLIGNRIFGCDDCQLVCPWNRYARLSADPDFAPRHGLDRARLIDLFGWDEDEWLRRTEGMALRRAGYARWLRNLAVALGNAPASDEIIAALQRRLDHPDEMVREHVRWALARHDLAISGAGRSAASAPPSRDR